MALVTSKQIRFRTDEYFRMSEAGVFGGRRVELLDGRICEMNAQADPHMAAITKTMILLNRHFGDMKKFWLIVQGTYRIEPYDALDPDFHIFDTPVGTALERRGIPFLVVEVSHTTYKRDSGIKLRRYAAAGVPDYWIVNIPEKRVEVYRNPENPTGRKSDWHYAAIRHFALNGKVKLLAYPRIEIQVRDMLP